LAGNGRVKGPAYRIDAAGLHLSAGVDRIDLDLQEPIADLAYASGGYVRVGLKGDLGRWRGWLAQVVTIPPDWQIAGAADASARVRLSAAGVDVDSAQATSTDPRFTGAGLNVTEPRLTLKPGTIKWDRKTGQAELHDGQV